MIPEAVPYHNNQSTQTDHNGIR